MTEYFDDCEDEEEDFQTCDEKPIIFFPKRTRKKKIDRIYPKMVQLFEEVIDPDLFEVPDEMFFAFYDDIILN